MCPVYMRRLCSRRVSFNLRIAVLFFALGCVATTDHIGARRFGSVRFGWQRDPFIVLSEQTEPSCAPF